MFDKNKFANIIRKIKDTYYNQEDFSKKSGIGRTYLSQYMNMKIDNPPKPRILEKLANASNGITTYKELMLICNYVDDDLDKICGNTISLISNPYTNNDDYNPAEQFLLSIIHTYNNLSNSTENSIEKYKIETAYKYIENDEEYSKLIKKYNLLKENFNFKKNSNYSLFLIPILGKIVAGQPILAEEYLEGYLPVDPNMYGMTVPDDYFYLKVSGESMNLKIHNGDYALIKKQDYAENGDIIVAIVNGDDEATLKKYKKLNDELVMLEPMSTYPIEPLVINLKNTKFQIIGKAIAQFGKF